MKNYDKTISESMFEEFCIQKDINIKKIETGKNKTPDYWLELEGDSVICEVKELTTNKDYEKFKKNAVFTLNLPPGKDKIHKLLIKATDQIKEYKRKNNLADVPSLVVLYNKSAPFVDMSDFVINLSLSDFSTISAVGILVITSQKDKYLDTYFKYDPQKSIEETIEKSLSLLYYCSDARLLSLKLIINQRARCPFPKVFQNIFNSEVIYS